MSKSYKRLAREIHALGERIDGIEAGLSERAQAEEWLDDDQVMEVLRISLRTLRKYRADGVLGYAKVGRRFHYRASEVEAHIRRQYVQPKNQQGHE